MTMTPLRYRVDSRQEDTQDTVTLVLTPVDRSIPVPHPGQFTMVYAFGVGEVPVSVSGRGGADGIVHTLRAVGAVTRALHAARPGDVLGVRGPYGVGWFLPVPHGADLVVIAGGIGLARCAR
jgi:NAD(P)H-flavin reductase